MIAGLMIGGSITILLIIIAGSIVLRDLQITMLAINANSLTASLEIIMRYTGIKHERYQRWLLTRLKKWDHICVVQPGETEIYLSNTRFSKSETITWGK